MTNEKAIEILKYHKCPDGKGMDCGKYSCAEHHEAIDKAIKSLTATTWIPCSESIPKDNKPYLVCDSQGNVCVRAITSRIKGKACWSQDKYDVVAWMPLLKPYREDEQ